ncbi:MAG: NYN domain-containing protein [Actinobacteria bacterium]|nr:NYN domain-containing protein [Actinomycetota bacterium]
MALPDPAVAAVIRGIAAYMVVARPTDLPLKLRPLRGKHRKMLTAHRNDIFAALDDDGFRALLLDWLKDDPAVISRADAVILLTAAQREEGWETKLAGDTPRHEGRHEGMARPTDRTGALVREKERVRKAREEARSAKAQAHKEVEEERKKTSLLVNQVDQLTRKVSELDASLAKAKKEAEFARSQMEREVRKARRATDQAAAALESSKATVKALRTDISKMKAVAPASRRAAPTPPAPRAPNEPTRRRRLTVPKGRFEDDPETLTEWLATPFLHLLVDGYNVSKAQGGFGDLALEDQRGRLLQEVGKLARKHKLTATVIFDGSDVAPRTTRRPRAPVEVEYSRADEIADDHLIAKLEGLPKYPVVVVTNDRELQSRAARLGATIATSNQLLGLIR